MTINELREKRNQAWNAAKAFVETKRDKDGLLSDEDSATYQQIFCLCLIDAFLSLLILLDCSQRNTGLLRQFPLA